ncbi:putative transcription factor Hap3/NF-YB family [Helianthus debilis subsp. tardiflorus]
MNNSNNNPAGASSKGKVGSSQPSETSFKRKRGVFQKDLQHMMYGFGDDPNVSISLYCTVFGFC